MKGEISVLILFLMVIPSFSYAQSKPDIYVKNAEVYPETIYEGDEVRINFTVGNSGSLEAKCNVGLFVDNSSQAVDKKNVSLDAGESKEESLYWIAKEGHHVILIFADYDNMVNEENEDNNIITIEVDVLKPQYPTFPPPSENASWWSPDWHYRVAVTVSMFGEREGYIYENKIIYCNINFSSLMEKIAHLQSGSFSNRIFYPDSVRVIEYKLENNIWTPYRNVGREIIFSDDYDAAKNANVTVKWVMTGDLQPHERRYYYVYWDTLENGHKNGEYGKIYSGIKNCEFEDVHSSQWKNYTSGALKWDIGYARDPIEGDKCYSIHAKGIYGFGRIWLNNCIARISQQFKIPDEGQSKYILHAKVYVHSDIDIFDWKIAVEGNIVESGGATSGWMEISKDITSYLKGKTSSLISFSVETTQSNVYTDSHEINASIDSVWIETENATVSLYKNATHGWWGNVYGLKNKYVAGVEGENNLDYIKVKTSAAPKEVVAKLYSPESKLMKASMPLPDPSFEEGYTQFFIPDEKTSMAEIQNIAHYGEKAIELRLSNYEGKFKFENENVKKGEEVGFRQNITYGLPIQYIPQLYFWYKIEKATSSSYLNYTLLTVGSSPCFLTIYMADLINDNAWHEYAIPESIISSWRHHGGKLSAIEMRLIAGSDGAENTIYIDDMGYSFLPKNATDRTTWEIHGFYNFTKGCDAGNWRVDITMADGSDYRIDKSAIIKVDAAADLDVFKIDCPSNLKEGQTGKFIVHVKNNGPRSVNSTIPINVSISIYQDISNPIKMRKSIAGLNTGEEKSIEFEWTALYGNASYNGAWHIMARINEENVIPEWDKTNNWRIANVEVEPRPDMEMKMDDVLFTPSHPSAGENLNISIIVHNIGYKSGDAKLNVYEKKAGERKYLIIYNESKIIGEQSWEKFYLKWNASNGTYNIKIEVECNDEINNANNVVIKDIKVGGDIDASPPFIKSIRANPSVQDLGEKINISAEIYDNETTIDKAMVYIKNGMEKEFVMNRLGESNIYYSNVAMNEIGNYIFYIEAWDTSLYQHSAKSNENKMRIIYGGIETAPPSIKGVTVSPEKQVIHGQVNISAYIDDESGIYEAYACIIHNGKEEKHEMTKVNGSKIFYYNTKYDETGDYEFYIYAIDSSANRNENVSKNQSFEIPVDYDMDDVPDDVELSIGSNPKNANETINVSIGNEFGYLLWIEESKKYVYWDKDDKATRDVDLKDVNGDGSLDILFDSNGDGVYDHYYDKKTKEIGVYEQKVKEKTETIWILPPAILFAILGIVFIMLKKR